MFWDWWQSLFTDTPAYAFFNFKFLPKYGSSFCGICAFGSASGTADCNDEIEQKQADSVAFRSLYCNLPFNTDAGAAYDNLLRSFLLYPCSEGHAFRIY